MKGPLQSRRLFILREDQLSNALTLNKKRLLEYANDTGLLIRQFQALLHNELK